MDPGRAKYFTRANTVSTKKQIARRSKKQKERLQRHKEQATQQESAVQCWRRLMRVFGEESEAMLRMASDGSSPSEIAERLQVPREKAEAFVERFTSLPHGFDKLLLKVPSVLQKEKAFHSTLKSALRSARAQRVF